MVILIQINVMTMTKK